VLEYHWTCQYEDYEDYIKTTFLDVFTSFEDDIGIKGDSLIGEFYPEIPYGEGKGATIVVPVEYLTHRYEEDKSDLPFWDSGKPADKDEEQDDQEDDQEADPEADPAADPEDEKEETWVKTAKLLQTEELSDDEVLGEQPPPQDLTPKKAAQAKKKKQKAEGSRKPRTRQ